MHDKSETLNHVTKFLSVSWPSFLLFVCQISVLADDILKNVEYDALRIIFNKFHSVVSFIPTVSTILSPEVIRIFFLAVFKHLAQA